MAILMVGSVEVLVDDEDLPMLSRYRWRTRPGKRKTGVRPLYVEVSHSRPVQALHRLLMGNPVGFDVDHRSGDTLDNRKDNLRLVTDSQNQANRHARCGAVPFKGVCFTSNKDGKFFAQIKVHGTSIYLGCFTASEEEARAYDRATLQHFGEFANINFPSKATV